MGTLLTRFLFCGFDENHFKERLYEASPSAGSKHNSLNMFLFSVGGFGSVPQKAGCFPTDSAEWCGAQLASDRISEPAQTRPPEELLLATGIAKSR